MWLFLRHTSENQWFQSIIKKDCYIEIINVTIIHIYESFPNQINNDKEKIMNWKNFNFN